MSTYLLTCLLAYLIANTVKRGSKFVIKLLLMFPSHMRYVIKPPRDTLHFHTPGHAMSCQVLGRSTAGTDPETSSQSSTPKQQHHPHNGPLATSCRSRSLESNAVVQADVTLMVTMIYIWHIFYLQQPTLAAMALCFMLSRCPVCLFICLSVRLFNLSVCAVRYCYHSVSWTAWTVLYNWQEIFTSPCWWPN